MKNKKKPNLNEVIEKDGPEVITFLKEDSHILFEALDCMLLDLSKDGGCMHEASQDDRLELIATVVSLMQHIKSQDIII